MDNFIQQCCDYGTYYNPASLHYANVTANVTCNRCYQDQLRVCIGYKNIDLCLLCVDQIIHNRGIINYAPIFY